MYNWINILYPVYILIIAYCHCSMSVFIHCRALRAFTHVCISTESFQGSYPDPLNKSIYTIIHSAFISIQCYRPSAQAAPTLGVVINLWHKVLKKKKDNNNYFQPVNSHLGNYLINWQNVRDTIWKEIIIIKFVDAIYPFTSTLLLLLVCILLVSKMPHYMCVIT